MIEKFSVAGLGANRSPPHTILFRMEIKYKIFPNNPRYISEEEMLQLGESMGDFGSLDGIVVNTSPGFYEGAVISGNQKTKQIGIEGMKPTITKRFKTPTRAGTVAHGYVTFAGELFPYREVYWSDDKCAVANLRANNYGGHNDAALLREFSHTVLFEAGINLEMVELEQDLYQQFLQDSRLEPQGKDGGEYVKEKYEQYLDNDVRQVVLFYDGEVYDRAVERMAELCEEHGVSGNSELILKLLTQELESPQTTAKA